MSDLGQTWQPHHEKPLRPSSAAAAAAATSRTFARICTSCSQAAGNEVGVRRGLLASAASGPGPLVSAHAGCPHAIHATAAADTAAAAEAAAAIRAGGGPGGRVAAAAAGAAAGNARVSTVAAGVLRPAGKTCVAAVAAGVLRRPGGGPADRGPHAPARRRAHAGGPREDQRFGGGDLGCMTLTPKTVGR